MNNILSFVIPIRHPENATDWALVKKNLVQTALSIANQDVAGWQAVVVANYGADLPNLPAGFAVRRVGFPPNPTFTRGTAPDEIVYDAVRLDKGRRVLAGLLSLDGPGHIMIVDDDDFVHRRLTCFVKENREANGWCLREGYVWSHGKFLFRHSDFSRLCGTSHIIRADLYRLPQSLDAANLNYVKRMLGSHVFIEDDLEAAGTPLAPLPFIGAVYRTGHVGAHSRSGGIFEQYLFRKDVLTSPRELVRRGRRFQWKSPAITRDFFGG